MSQKNNIMVKIQNNNFLESVNDVFIDSSNKDALYLFAKRAIRTERNINVKNKKLDAIVDEKTPKYRHQTLTP
ncbi:MAG: hypothetical protein ACOH2D_16870 [Gelidibacter sp.]